MNPRKNKFFYILVLLFFVTAHSARSVERYNLKQFQERAESSGTALGEARARLQYADSRQDYAKSQSLPTGKIESVLGVGPGAEGNALNGTKLWSRWGLVSSTQIELIQPLFAFGALSGARNAAKAAYEAEEKLFEKDRWQLRTEIAELYFGYQLAFEFSELASDVSTKLEEALQKAQKKKRKESDISQLKIFLTEAGTRRLEAEKGMSQARMGMAWKMGLYESPRREEIRWDHSNLSMKAFSPLKKLEDYQNVARRERPELKALQKEIEAKEALVRVERGQLYPAFYVGAKAEYAVAPEIQNQSSPFAYDPYNETSVGVGVGLRWNLGFFERNGKIGMARAELLQAEAKTHHLGAGILAEVEKCYLDFKQLEASLRLREEGRRLAQRLYTDSLYQFGLGNGDAKTFFERLGNYVSQEKVYLETLYAFNLGISKLEQAIGTPLENL